MFQMWKPALFLVKKLQKMAGDGVNIYVEKIKAQDNNWVGARLIEDISLEEDRKFRRYFELYLQFNF